MSGPGIGGGMASEGQVPREPQIPRAINELSALTDTLEEAVGKLVDKLDPAMSESHPVPGVEGKLKNAESRAAITTSIEAVTNRLSQVLNSVTEMSRRLEL